MSIVHIAFYPSDWLAGTRGLSAEETGVYITLIARMYEMAGPIERDDQRLARLCGCKSVATFKKCLEYLIGEGKIIEGETGLFNNRVEKEVQNSIEKSSKARAAAESRWDRKSSKNNDHDLQAHPSSICQPEPEPYIDKSTNVLLSEPIAANDQTRAIERFNAAAEKAGWSQVQKMNANRSKQLRARLKDCGGLEGWEVALRKAFDSDFCRGRTAKPWNGFSFDWLVKPANFTKLMEGNYDNRDHPGRGLGGGSNSMVDAFAAVAAGFEV